MKNSVVLIVDDDSGFRQNLAGLLQERGCHTLEARDAREGVALLQRQDVHLALVDLDLPDLSGVELMERIKANHPRVEILILTGEATLQAAIEAYDRGAFAFLPKPCDSNRIVLQLERARDRQQAEKAGRLRQRAIDATPSGILIAEAKLPKLPIVYVNQAFQRITGFAAEEVLGRSPRFLYQADPHQPGLGTLRTALRRQREDVILLRNFRKDGTPFWNELAVAPMRDERGVVTHFIGTLNDITDRKCYQELLEFRSCHDRLTGLPNRHLLMDRIIQALYLAHRHQNLMAIMYLDLDHFKTVNDHLGHPMGDRLLKVSAERIVQCVRSTDTVARQGGDEFVIVLSDLEMSEDAARVAQKIRKMISKPLTLGGRELTISCSIGISVYPKDGNDPQTLLKNADVALYRAKEKGRNDFQFFTEELNQKVHARRTMEKHLRRALEKGEFSLLYQPQVDLLSGRIVGVEALIRWKNPELGEILPARFIPLAEETGLIGPIGEWVLLNACRQIRAWQVAGFGNVRMETNLSPKQFLQKNLVEMVARVTQNTGLDPRFLGVGVVESFLLQDVKGAERLIGQLKELGVQLTIDGFGAAQSSLSYLKLFPFDKIKVASAFVGNITHDPGNGAITKAIIAMAHSLKLRVLAERVETEGQLNLLRRYGCDEMQGFVFSPPLPSAPMEQMLREDRHLPAKGKIAADNTLLLVDDEKGTLQALLRSLDSEGYHILTALNAVQGFELLATHEVGVVISDHRMPGMGGTEFLARVKELHPDAVRVLLTGYSELSTAVDSVNRGAVFRYLTKPWEETTLREEIREAFWHYRQKIGISQPLSRTEGSTGV